MRACVLQVAEDWEGKGKVVVMTGASAGLGAEATRVLAERGATGTYAQRLHMLRHAQLTA